MLETKRFCGQCERKKDHKRGIIVLSISISFSLDTCIPKMPPNNKYKRTQNSFSEKKKFALSVPKEFKKYKIKDCRVCLVPLTKFVAAEYGITDLPRAIKVAVRTGSYTGSRSAATARTFKHSSEYLPSIQPSHQPCKIEARLPFIKDLQKPVQCILNARQNGFKVHYSHMSKTESEKYNPNISYPCTEISRTFRLDTDLEKLEEGFRKCKVVLERLSEKELKSYLCPLEAPKEESVLLQTASENSMKRKRMNFKDISEMYEENRVSWQSSIFNQKGYFRQEREKSMNFDKICKNFGNVSKILEDTSYLSQRQDRLNFIYCVKRKERITFDDAIIEHITITDRNKTLRNEDRNKLSIPGGTDTESDTLSQKKCVPDTQDSSIGFDNICETSEPEKQDKTLNLNNRCKTGRKRKCDHVIYASVIDQNNTLRDELCNSESIIGAASTESNALHQENCVQLEQCSLTDSDNICENSAEGDEVHFGDGDVSQNEYTEPQQKQKSVDLYNKHNKEEEDAKASDKDYVEDKVKEKFTPLRVQTEHDGVDKYLCLENKSNEVTEEAYRVIDQTESSQEDHEHSVLATEVPNEKSGVLNHEKHVQQQQELYLDNSSETDDVDEMFVDHDQVMESKQIKDLVALGNVCNKDKAIYQEKTQIEFEEHFYLEDRNNDDIECNNLIVDKSKLSEDEQRDLVSMADEIDKEDEDSSQKKWVLKEKDHTIDSANSSKNDNVGETFVGIQQSIELQQKQKSIDLNNGYSKEKDKELNSTENDIRQYDELDDNFCLINSNNEHNKENDSTVDENKTLQNEQGDSVSVVNAADEKRDVISEERWVQPQQDYQTDFDKSEDVDETFLNSGQCVESQQEQESADLAYHCDIEGIRELFIPIYDIRKQSKFHEYFTLEDTKDEIIEDSVLIINNDKNIIIEEIGVLSQADQRIDSQEESADLSSDCNMEDIKELISPIHFTIKHDELDKHFSLGNRNNEVREEKSLVIDQNKISQEDQADLVPAAVGTLEKCYILNHKTCVQQEKNSLDFDNSSENDASETFVNGEQCTKSQHKQELICLDNNSNQGVKSLIIPANDDNKQFVSDEHFCLKNKNVETMEESGFLIVENKASQEEKENSVQVVDISDEGEGVSSQQTCVQELQEQTMNSSQNGVKGETFPHSEQCMEVDVEQGTIALNNDCNKEMINELIFPEYDARKQAEFQEQPCLEDKNDEAFKENSPEIAKNKILQFEQQYSITDETFESSDISSQGNCSEERHTHKMNVDSFSEIDDVKETFQGSDECTDSEQKSVDLEDNCKKQIVRDLIISLPDARKQAKFEEHFRSENRTNEYTERNVFTVDVSTVDSTSVIDVTDEEDDALVENNQCRDSQEDKESIGIINPYNEEKTKELIKPLDDTGKQAEGDENFRFEKRSNAIIEKKSRISAQNKTLQDNKDDSIPTVALTDGRGDVLSEEWYAQQEEEHSMHFDNHSQQIQKSIDLYDDCNKKKINEQSIPAHIARKADEYEEHIYLENKNKELILENGGIICQSKISHDERDDSLSVTDSGDEESPNQQRLEASVHLMDASDISDDDCEVFDDKNYPMHDERKQNKIDEYLLKNKRVEVLVENHCTKDHYNTPQDNDEGRFSNIFQPYSMPVIDTSNKEQAHEILVVLDDLSDVSEEGDASDAFGESLKNSEAAEENGMKENADNDSSEGKMDNEDFNKEPKEMNNSSSEAKSENEDFNTESVKMNTNSSEAKTENEDSKTGSEINNVQINESVVNLNSGIAVDSHISREKDGNLSLLESLPVCQYEDISEDDDDFSSKNSHSQDVKSVDPREVLRILTSVKKLATDKSLGSDWTNSNITKHNEKENIVSDSEGKNVSDIAAEKLPETQTDLDSKNVLPKRTAEGCRMVLRSQKKSPNKKRSRKRVGKSTKVNKRTSKSHTKETNVESDNKHITVEDILQHSASQVLNPEECDEKGSTVIVLNTNLKSQKRKRSVENCDSDRRVKKNGKFGTLVKESYKKYENNADFLETVSYNNKLHIEEFPFG